MEQELRAIALGLEWADRNGIDLDERIGSVMLFTPEELVSLRDFLRVNRRAGALKPVHPVFHYNRCQYFRDYITWLTERVISRMPPEKRYVGASKKLQDFRKQLMQLLRRGGFGRSAREGLSKEVEARLREVIEPDHPDNPFRRKHRVRNHALILCYLELGVRLSEALVVKGHDVAPSGSNPTLTIHRRPDDPDEKRAMQPLVKTAGRILPLGDELRSALMAWMAVRKDYPGAKRLPYVFVTEDGTALSRSTASDMFRLLRTRVSGLTPRLSAHLLRHTWNDRFSERADELRTAPEDEMRHRIELMGWSQNSKMAFYYTKRHIRRAAAKASLDLQSKSVAGLSL